MALSWKDKFKFELMFKIFIRIALNDFKCFYVISRFKNLYFKRHVLLSHHSSFSEGINDTHYEEVVLMLPCGDAILTMSL